MSEWQDKAEGKLDEAQGALTGDESREKEGEAEGAWGDVQEKAGDAKDEVEERF